MEKPINLLLDEEINKLRSAILGAVADAKLPAPVTKLVIECASKDVLYTVDNQINEERMTFKAKD